jgi:hypothetical protein
LFLISSKEEFGNISFGSKTLNDRSRKTMETLNETLNKSIFVSSNNRSEANAIRRIFCREKFDMGKLLQPHKESITKRIGSYGHPTFIVVQDTTGASHNGHKKKESFRWLETMEKSKADLPDGTKVIDVCNLEGDIQ